MNYAITTRDLTKKYKDLTAVDNLDLEIIEGELFALLGVNGAGKTTTIKMLSTLTRPSGGDAMVSGESIVTSPLLVKERIGVSPQETAVAPSLSVRENLSFMCKVHGIKKDKAEMKIEELSKALDLESVMDRKAGKLSGGWQRRLSIAMALVSEPKVLFLDEPTGALDEQTGRQVLDYISRLQTEYGFTIVMVTHNLNIAEMANTVIRMNSGRISEIYTNDTQKTAYEIGW